MRKFILKLLFLLPIPLVMAGINFVMDPANLFHTDYVQKVVDILLSGQNVANITNCSERLLQKSFLERQNAKVDILVLGSSRTLEIRHDFFPGSSFYNASVPSATIEDYIALYELLRQKKKLPQTLILGWDPWTLRDNTKMTQRWKELEPYYSLYAERLGLKKPASDDTVDFSWNRIRELFLPDYLKESLTWIYKGYRRDSYFATTADELDVPVRRADGSIAYPAKSRLKSEDEVRRDVLQADDSRPAFALLGSHEKIDPRQQAKIEQFVDEVLKDGVKVRFLLLPYHELIFRQFKSSEQYQLVIQAQDYFTTLSDLKKIALDGSYNPRDLSLMDKDFYDEMHVRGTALASLVERLHLKKPLENKLSPN